MLRTIALAGGDSAAGAMLRAIALAGGEADAGRRAVLSAAALLTMSAID